MFTPLLWVLLAACTGRPSVAEDGLPDVVLVVLDTTRPNRLSLYGHDRPTSPRLDRFAADAVVYDNAYSTSSWTAPAHASMFTGRYAVAHHTTQESWDLQPVQETMAERLGSLGYDTLGVVSNGMLAKKRGFDQGFQDYREAWRERGGENADEVAAGWVEDTLAKRGRRPTFLFVNLIGPHSPYDSCGVSCGTWGTQGTKTGESNLWSRVYLGRRSWTEADLAHFRDLYDDELLEVDRQLGRILDAVAKHGQEDNTLVIVTSDHGEHFGEHGHVDHVFSLHEPVVRIPLVIQWPGKAAGRRVSERVQLTDLLPTVLGAVGRPDPSLQGFDLAQGAPAGREMFLEYYRAIQAFQPIESLGRPAEVEKVRWRQRRLKAVIAPNGDKLHHADDGHRELYALSTDPAELRDLAASDPRKRLALEERLDALTTQYADPNSGPPATGATDVDEETRKVLESLGYLAPEEDE